MIRFLLLLAAALALAATAEASPLDWLVEDDTVVVGEARTIEGDVIVQGATLDLRGTHLDIGGRLYVGPNATLLLGPEGDNPTVLSPIGDDRFWLQIDGHVESRGEPRTIVEGLSGDGLDSVVLLPGGFKINGTAVLKDIVIQHGTAGLIVEPGASLELRDAELRDLYLMGLATLGDTLVERTQFSQNIISVTGKSTCDITIRDSTIDSMGAHFQMNGCPLTAERLQLIGGDIATVLNAPATYRFTDVHWSGYQRTGMRLDTAATVHIDGATFEPHDTAIVGIDVRPGNEVFLTDVEASGHQEDGLRIQSSYVHVTGGAFTRNGQYGISVVGQPPIEADWSGVELGDGDPAFENGEGGLSIKAYVNVMARNGAASLSGFDVKVEGADGEVLFEHEGDDRTSVLAVFETHRSTDEGVVELGPFEYEVRHDLLGAQRGQIEPDQGALILEPAASVGEQSTSLLRPLLLAGGMALLAWALLGQRAMAVFRKKRRSDPEGPR